MALETVRHGEKQLAALKAAAESSPAWRLELGADALTAPAAVAERIVREVE